MRHLNKLASIFCGAALGLMAMTGCEGGDLYNVNSPDWLADAIAEANANKGEEELVGMNEDVYTIGNTDYSSGWWQAFSKYYVVPDGQKWNAQFTLNIKPDDQVYYHNFALIICADADRGTADYKEYGAIRFDLTNDTITYNSQWGSDFYKLPFKFASSTSMQDPTADETGLQKLAGAVTLTVDRSDPSKFLVKFTNGTVTRTYEQPYPLGNLNADASNTNIRCFLVPEGSFLNFLSSNIEPIGGYTSAEDKQPLSMELKGVPKKVLQGTDFATLTAGVSAVVEFEQGVSKTVGAADLTFETVPDLNSLGTKNLIAVYNKTFKGENCATPVIAFVSFEVVDKMYTLVGAADNSSAWWTEHSEKIKVNPGETFVSTFTNYTSGGANWNNFAVVLNNASDEFEYGVLRADNWGWGTGWEGKDLATKCTPSGGQSDWGAWLAAMDGAKVTVYVTNNGNGTADVRMVMLGTDGNTYMQDYIGLNTVTNPDDFYFHLTIDNSHIEFDDVLGEEDNSSGFWTAHSPSIKIPAGQTYTRRFRNYTSGGANWNNFVVVLNNSSGEFEYGVFRADNWGWGTGWEGKDLPTKCTPSGGPSNWETWLAAMDDAMVTVSVTNHGNGTADVKCVMLGNDGNTYTQDYIGLNTVTDPDDFYFHFTIDGCHLVFE